MPNLKLDKLLVAEYPRKRTLFLAHTSCPCRIDCLSDTWMSKDSSVSAGADPSDGLPCSFRGVLQAAGTSVLGSKPTESNREFSLNPLLTYKEILLAPTSKDFPICPLLTTSPARVQVTLISGWLVPNSLLTLLSLYSRLSARQPGQFL